MTASASKARAPGLTQDEADRRFVEYGPNAIPEARPVSIWRRFIGQFKSPLIYILVLALALDLGIWLSSGADHMPWESFAIAAILVLNAGLGTWQESKSEAALARLEALAAPSVWVLRDGALVQLGANRLVPGDMVRIEAGDRVPADGRLVDGQGVMADESILTGESLAIEKDLESELLSGTLLVRGKGYLEVARTGPSSTMGRLAVMIGSIEMGKTPLERRLGVFGNQVAIAILALGLFLTIGGVAVEGIGRLGQVVLFSVALAVAAVPEGLPAVLTLTLALGVERLAARKAIVRRLSAVEALGSVTVIATDKTGTLTENRMFVRSIDAPDETRALAAMVLANDAERDKRIGDPLELALLDHAVAQGLDTEKLVAESPRCAIEPFDSATRFMAVTVTERGRRVSYLKGAPEVLIARSTMSKREQEVWSNKALAEARKGNRVLALAWCEDEHGSAPVFLGLVMLWDPPRPEVPDAIARATAAGIRVVMITGDHPATAEAVALSVGLRPTRVLTGEDMDRLSPEALRDAVREIDVFARVAPEHKLRLVETLKDMGEIVAVTGDGVNDAPALKRSDVGVAMGLRGSDVSREVSDIVLLDDNFATIVAAIEEGRNIYENIQKFIRFLFSTNLALIALIVIGLAMAFLLGLKDPSGATFLLPLTAVQLLWINVVADGPPALALAIDRNPGLMARPPRPAGSGLLDSASLRFIAVSAALKAGVGIGILVVMPWHGYGMEQTRTTLFLYESIMQLVFAYPCRRIGAVPLPNVWLHIAVGSGVALQVLTVLLPPLRALLGLVPLDLPILILIAVTVLATWALAEAIGRMTQSGRYHPEQPRSPR